MLYYITCKKCPTILISGKKSVRNFYASEILTVQYNTFKYFIRRRHQAKYTCHRLELGLGFSRSVHHWKGNFLLLLQKKNNVQINFFLHA